MTHGHPDHTGALPQLLRESPSAQLVVHEKEAPFIPGRQSYVPTGALVVKVLQGLGLAGREQVKVRCAGLAYSPKLPGVPSRVGYCLVLGSAPALHQCGASSI